MNAPDLFQEPLPPLPEPGRTRWQPLRLGLVELYRYDSEEFWFHDGHLLLRGNNGTGKSKVLSLTLPLLFDAQMRSARVEPDGDAGKKMSWNLLLGGVYERRTGYSWIEFGRLDDAGRPHFLTLGVGLQAVASRTAVDAWYFVVDGGARLGRDLWLIGAQRLVHTKERLREALGTGGRVFDSAEAYRRTVDERLFQLGAARYDALVDTLIQLRQPQLSRRPDEAALSTALTEALPPLPQALLADVAEALTQLEDDRRQLEQAQSLLAAVRRFEQRYRLYAGLASRRQARRLRQAQTGFDEASRARHEAQQAFESSRAAEDSATERRRNAERMLAGARTRLETLQADPLHQTANQLDAAQLDAGRRERAVADAEADTRNAADELGRETRRLDESAARLDTNVATLERQRHEALAAAEATGLARDIAPQRWFAEAPAKLALERDDARQRAAEAALMPLPGRRREQVAQVRRRLAENRAAAQEAAARQRSFGAARVAAEDAAARRAAAEAAVEAEAAAHFDAWSAHLWALQVLDVPAEVVLAALAAWLTATSTDHPARTALQAAHGQSALGLAAVRHTIVAERRVLEAERAALESERARLARGEHTEPEAPPWRDRAARVGHAGAPLWQLVDFDPDTPPAERDGLESALDAAGLLDAWVTPTGEGLRGADGMPWVDVQLLGRRPWPGATVGRWLRPDTGGSGVPAERLDALLDGIACDDEDPPEAEAWLGRDGRFRLAGRAGAATPRPARFIGHAARAAARSRRLAEIGTREAELAEALRELDRRAAEADAGASRLDAEWRGAPGEQALLRAHDAAAARQREALAAGRQSADAEGRWREADALARRARETLEADAGDLRLPGEAAALEAIDARLHELTAALHALATTVRLLGAAEAERQRQAERSTAAEARRAEAGRRLDARRVEHEEARTRLAALMAVHGADVDALKRRIVDARRLAARVQQARDTHEASERKAVERRARDEQRSADARARFEQRSAERAHEVERWQAFAATGLLASALSGQDAAPEMPPLQTPWTIEPALALARRTEQALASLDDDDERWKRVQAALTDELTRLQSELGALGHQAAAEANDFGVAVRIVWHQQAEPPEQLAARLVADVQAREALLSAREREVLENHLQAEIASEMQRLVRAADRHLNAVNAELAKRPTGTGVRFRLRWESLTEADGAPAGWPEARERLMQSGAELWSVDERRSVGRMLQQRIQDQRRASEGSVDPGGSLLEQLAAALDHRRWHRFRVERLQDGQWRRLAGPASSGERALGLTVPLFAAIASFYRESPLAPRLMMLDEAFAGIDDAARAHCMGLVDAFDLDFVITSEREWGCYATLPGVAICQLQRREGIDAVFVSRWRWDGVARRREPDGARRFPVEAST